VCAVCGTVRCGFGGVSVQEVALWCVWDIFVWEWGSKFVLCVGEIGVGLVECVCAVCETDCVGLVE